jgi:hypothetical protein
MWKRKPLPLTSFISALARDFAFVAGDKDSCMLKCHVFHCDVPAKAIASALQGLCAQVKASGGQGIWGWERVSLAPYPDISPVYLMLPALYFRSCQRG